MTKFKKRRWKSRGRADQRKKEQRKELKKVSQLTSIATRKTTE